MNKKLLLLVSICFFGVDSFSQELIVDGGFESGGTSNYSAIAGVTIQSVEKNTGTYAAELRNTNQAYFSQVLPVHASDTNLGIVAGETYRVSAYFKGDGGIGGVPFEAFLAVQFKNASNKWEHLRVKDMKSASTTEFTQFSFLIVPTANQIVNDIRFFYIHKNGGGKYWIDDISVQSDSGVYANDKEITATTYGVVDNVNKRIVDVDVSSSLTVGDFLAGLTLSAGAEANISTSTNGRPPAADPLSAENTIKVFAEDGTYQVYTIVTSNNIIKSISSDEAVLDNTNYIISGITPVLAVEAFKNDIELFDGATLEVLDAVTKNVIANQSNATISESMIVRVTGATGYQDYTLQLRVVETNNTIVSIGVGSINESGPAIEDIPNGITVNQLNDFIQVATYAGFQLIDSSGVVLDGTSVITNTDQIRVTAEDGSTRIYTIVFGGTAITNTTYTDQNVSTAQLSYTNVTLEGASELKISDTTTPFLVSSVNINSEDSWIIFENILPSVVRDNYLSSIQAYGQPAVLDQNVRIVRYVDGAVVIPHGPNYEAVEIFDGPNLTGNSMKLTPYTYNKIAQLGGFNDAIASFKVKRGYYVTLAQNEDGTGYSKVFIAHDADLVINAMPIGLENKVSFARVIPWRWPTKKGHPGNGINSQINISWTYNWGASATSSLDIEFVPIRHNLGWPSYNNFINKKGSPHMLGHNEPDRPDQANATVDQVLAQWPKLMESGLRIGSPAPSDGGLNWLFNFIDRCDELNYRVDFVAIHWYRGCQSAQGFYDFAQYVHQRTGRPIWITEWNNGANWTSCKPQSQSENAAKVDAFIKKLDEAPFVERYCIFPYLGSNWSTVSGGSLTETGIVYRDQDSPMAFNPNKEYENPFNTLPKPTNLVATWDSGDASIDLTWDDMSEYENGVKIERNINNAGWVEIARIETPDLTYYNDTDVSFGVYKYRVRQMIVAQSNSAYSNVETLTVLRDGDMNVAFEKATTTSSIRDSYIGSEAVDGDVGTDPSRWLTAVGAPYPHWIEIDLEGTFDISGLKLYTGYGGNYNKSIKDFKFQYWNGTAWVNLLNIISNSSSQYVAGFNPVETTKVRLEVTKSDDNIMRLYEIEVLGRAASLGVDDQTLHRLVSVYPNPVNGDVLNIKGYQHITSLEVYNALGVKYDTFFNKGKLDVSNLSIGLYFLRLNKQITIKFIKK